MENQAHQKPGCSREKGDREEWKICWSLNVPNAVKMHLWSAIYSQRRLTSFVEECVMVIYARCVRGMKKQLPIYAEIVHQQLTFGEDAVSNHKKSVVVDEISHRYSGRFFYGVRSVMLNYLR